MKKGIFSICTLIFLFACKKNNSNTPTSTGKLVTSIRLSDFFYQIVTLDSLSYDNNGRIARIIQWDYDSTQGLVLSDSSVWTFSYTGAATNPSSYSTVFYYAGVNNISDFTEDHTLSYDNQGRVIFDTSLMVYHTSEHVPRESYFKYTAAYTVINQAAAYKDMTDTLFMDNGNVTGFSASADSTGLGAFDFDYVYTYAGTPNPLYNSTISTGIGPLLLVRTYIDFISKYVPATFKDIFNGGPELAYSYTTNTLGLPLNGLGKDKSSGELIQSVTYHYQ